MQDSQERLRRLAHVATRYYLEDWKQSDIAKELGVSAPWSAGCSVRPGNWVWWRSPSMLPASSGRI